MQHSTFPRPRSVIETILVLLLLLALLFALYDALKVFFGVFTFALIFYVSFERAYARLVRALNNRWKLAAFIYSFVLLLVVALPIVYLVTALGRHAKELVHFVQNVHAHGLPPLPENLASIPFIGDFWQELRENPRETITGHEHEVKMVLHHIVTGGAGIVAVALQVILGIIISAFLLAAGEKVLQPLKATLQHLLGKRDGLTLLDATAHAIRGVSIGVIGTAFIATVISWIGLTIAGIHFRLLLCALIFFFVLIQIGPLAVWLPLVIWMATQGHMGMTIFLAAYGVFVLVIDAVLKPVLIAKSGGKLPFLVLFLGVIGGVAAWGFTGMFKGAIILAVFYTIFNSWLESKKSRVSAEVLDAGDR